MEISSERLNLCVSAISVLTYHLPCIFIPPITGDVIKCQGPGQSLIGFCFDFVIQWTGTTSVTRAGARDVVIGFHRLSGQKSHNDNNVER